MLKEKWNKIQFKNKSIIFALLMSLIVPIIPTLLLWLLSKVVSDNLFYSLIDLQALLFLEVNLLSVSLLWLLIRFIPLVPLAYLNGWLLEKKFKKLERKNLYLWITSILIYFVSLAIGALIMFLMSKVGFLNNVLEVFKAFSI
ncbi:MAG: hypothetical protein A2912_01375 [Candidatus Buchananbacteria bacterium RIFCSPLOWO2_01_FULL_40_23b]|uniref:DUF5671 domain-containing protein n=1 Tax=Candidatus Buchananbacteria bacterium RIFCSPLOWO2_01_FULL_40_23b TaxID=1797544 RepID=A0A1G1YMZ4_9BACT|nr:MAG: hypothetical protein A2912_01375 [Candidatus Buchananbacteria bacterium RIFCSPLOWO2_01_FULL_40_23b]